METNPPFGCDKIGPEFPSRAHVHTEIRRLLTGVSCWVQSKKGILAQWTYDPKSPEALAMVVLFRFDGNLKNAIRHVGHVAANTRKMLATSDPVSYYRYGFLVQDKERIDNLFVFLKELRDSLPERHRD